MLTNGRYTFMLATRPGSLGEVLDEHTGRHIAVGANPGCAPSMIGHGYLLAQCAPGNRIGLYALPRGPWISVTPYAKCVQWIVSVPASRCEPVAVGRAWIRFAQSCDHCQTFYEDQNIRSGAVQADPTSQHVIADLDSPKLSQRVCAPLSVPPGGDLRFEGTFAITSTSHRTYLERCGATLHQLLSTTYAATSAHVLLWWSRVSGQLGGMFLPSRWRFTINLPASCTYPDELLLADRHVYVNGSTSSGTSHTWAAAIPRPPTQPR